ncbi:hypothetical protein [Bacillus sp. T3]|nr:hypothetical protein [Bacillus sp. T3]
MPQQKLTIVPVTLDPVSKNSFSPTSPSILPQAFARLKWQTLKSPSSMA